MKLSEFRDHTSITIKKIYDMKDNFIQNISNYNLNHLHFELEYVNEAISNRTDFKLHIKDREDNVFMRMSDKKIRVYKINYHIGFIITNNNNDNSLSIHNGIRD